MKKILFICPHPEKVAPGQRLKYEQYFESFRESGYQLDIEPFFDSKFQSILYEKGKFFKKILLTIKSYIRRTGLLFRIRQYDLVYIFLWVTPIGIPFFEFLVSKISKSMVYDIDDMVFLGHASDANRRIKALKGKKKMIYLMKKANHVITCTPILDEFVRKYNRNTTDISSTVNTDLYIPKKANKIEGETTIGWSGSHSTSKYLKILEPVFIELLDEYNLNFKILVIGDKDFKFDSSKISLETKSWKLDSEVEDLKNIDIGVYPLPNEQWVYGKSGLKAIQYMALGIPTVATSWGTINRIIKDGENGFLASNNKEWVNAFLSLIEDQELREKFNKNGVKTIHAKFSVNANRNTYLDIIKKVI